MAINPERDAPPADRDFFFYLEHRIRAARDVATGREIKQMIKALVPAFDLDHVLVLEGHGPEADRVIRDDETVSLEVGPHEPPKHFFSKPPTHFG